MGLRSFLRRLAALGLVLSSVFTAARSVADADAAVAAVDLAKHERKVFSQFGEDGVIEKLFEIIEPTSRFSVEFGAADGILTFRQAKEQHRWNAEIDHLSCFLSRLINRNVRDWQVATPIFGAIDLTATLLAAAIEVARLDAVHD